MKAKGTGARHRRQTVKELAKQEQDGPRIYSDFFYACVEIQQIRQSGVKFYAGFIQQTGVRRFINKSDGEPAMNALKDAAAKAQEGVESNGQESLVGDNQANGDIESAVRTLKAQR